MSSQNSTGDLPEFEELLDDSSKYEPVLVLTILEFPGDTVDFQVIGHITLDFSFDDQIGCVINLFSK